MGIFDYFTPEARRGNREWLDSQNAAISEALRYYLGPTGIPERLGLLAESTPTAGLERAGTESSRMFAPGLSGWDRMAAAGNMLSETAGAGAGLLGMPAAGRMADDLVEAAAPTARQFMRADEGGLRLYHGSPHSFDKFSMDKIGTGEGAQAYGHGLYFADNEGVARSYRDQLSRPYYVTASGEDVAKKYGDDVLDVFNGAGGDPSEIGETITRLRGQVQRDLAEFGVSDVSQLKPMYDGDVASNAIKAARRADSLEALLKSGDVTRAGEGSMYEVNINANPEAFVDIEKPLKDQPGLEPALRKYWGRYYDSFMSDGSTSDGDYFRQLSQDPANKNLNVQEMRDAGIPGLKYLDAGSRGNVDVNELRGEVSMWTTAVNKTPNDDYAWKMLEDAESALKQAEAGLSRNYVIFDENLINIVRKYGIAGAAAMLGMSQADVAQAMGQQPQGLLESGPQ